ncbi:hypothetical protein F4778DRAFT_741756 [Xylariomycetidae sp. FL2044]|nr:hypothetical protein F4778DRAFT_741756 [Xylariomycetidae sp. FL2044]
MRLLTLPVGRINAIARLFFSFLLFYTPFLSFPASIIGSAVCLGVPTVLPPRYASNVGAIGPCRSFGSTELFEIDRVLVKNGRVSGL